MEPFAVGLAASAASTVLLNERVTRHLAEIGDAPALSDIVHRNIPPVPVWVPDALLLCTAAIFAVDSPDDRHYRLAALGLALGARAVTIHLTLLPSPVPTDAYCHGWDLWVSGHTLAFCAFFPSTPSLSVLGSFSLIVSRQHYTIDVVGAAMLYKLSLDAMQVYF